MKKFGLVYGLFLYGFFLATGQYLKLVIVPDHSDDLFLRMMFKANHIYILLVSVATIFSSGIEFHANKLGHITRALIYLAATLISLSFVFETGVDIHTRRFVFWGCVLITAAAILFVVDRSIPAYASWRNRGSF